MRKCFALLILFLNISQSFSQDIIYTTPLIEKSTGAGYFKIDLLKIEKTEKATIAFLHISVPGSNMIRYTIPNTSSPNAFVLVDIETNKEYKQIKKCRIDKKILPIAGDFDFFTYDEHVLQIFFEKLDDNVKKIDLYEGIANKNRWNVINITGIILFTEDEKITYFKNKEIEEKRIQDEKAIAYEAQRKIDEEKQRKENERLQSIKLAIENTTFTGNHFYNYDGFKYTGSFVNGVPNGNGKWEKPDGSWYQGQFKNGMENGVGTLRQTSGLRYTGNFTDGVPNGIFKIEQWTLMGLSRNEWQAEYQNGKLISSTQTNDGMDRMFSGNTAPPSNNSNQTPSNSGSNSKVSSEYKIPDIKKIEFEQTKSSFVMGESEKYFVTYKDGVTGYLFYSKKYHQWYINNSTADFAYDTKENALAALYEYKDKGSIRKAGRKD